MERRAMIKVCSRACWPESTECGTTSVNVIQVAPGGKSKWYLGVFFWKCAYKNFKKATESTGIAVSPMQA